MRCMFALVLTVCVGVAADATCAQGATSSAAVVTVSKAPYFGEGSDRFEPAGYLAQGTPVEVYGQHGQWLAIRPPSGAFSWVAVSHAEATGESDIVRVVAKNGVSWIGHDSGDIRRVSQLPLKEGELLQVLAMRQLPQPGSESGEWFYKVSPPAGEFRFIQAQYIQQTQLLQKTTPTTQIASLPSVSATTVGWTARGSGPGENDMNAGLTNGLSTLSVSPPVVANGSTLTPAQFAQQLKTIDLQLSAMVAQQPVNWNLAPLAGQLQALVHVAPTQEAHAQVQQLWSKVQQFQQIQLGYAQLATQVAARNTSSTLYAAHTVAPQVVYTPAVASVSPSPILAAPALQTPAPAQAPTTWQPAPVQNATPTRNVPAVSPSAPLVMQIQRAAEDFVSAVQDGAVGSSVAPANRGTPATSVSMRTEFAPELNSSGQGIESDTDSRFDATGWLMPLVPRSRMERVDRTGVPPFALTDDDGNVLFLVTPSAGANLRQYLRKRVGVQGRVSQLPDLQNPHIVAQRVVVLERHE